MKEEKKIFTKLIAVLLIIILLSFMFPRHSEAGVFRGIFTKPLCWFIVETTDSFNLILASVSIPVGTTIDNIRESLEKNDSSILEKIVNAGPYIEYQALMSPDRIFSGDVKLLDANIFTATTPTNIVDSIENWFKNGNTSLAEGLKSTVANVYLLLRNMCAVIMLCLLIYTGIRILLASASPYDQAKWKKALIEWIKGLCLLMFMHFIMIGVFNLSDLIVEGLKKSLGSTSIVANIRWAFTNSTFSWDDSGAIITTILYVYVTYLTIVFFIAYFKRFVWIVILTLLSPVVATTYAFGGSQTKIFNTWIKEYIFAVILQPFHMLIFYVLVGVPLSMLGKSTSGFDINSILNPLDSTSLMVNIYILLSISMIRPAEKFFMKLFGFSEMSVAKQGSTESGVKTIKQVEKVVKEVVTTAVQIGTAVATGGATAAMGGAAAAAGTAGQAANALGTAEQAANALGTAEQAVNGLSEAENIASERSALDEMLDEGTTPGSNWTDADFKAYEELERELGEREETFNSNNAANISSNANTTDASEIKEAAAELKSAAKALSAAVGNGSIDVSDGEFDEAIGDKKPKNRLMERLENSERFQSIKPHVAAGVNYLKSPEAKEHMNELSAGMHGLRDSMYLEDASESEWKGGVFGYDARKGKIDETKKSNLSAFVNNKNNINYMKQEHNLTEKEAKSRLESAAPFVNRGITNVEAIDKLITAAGKGQSTDGAIRSVAKTAKIEARTESVVNDQSKVSAVAQIIASKTGENVKSVKVQQEAKQTMQAARPYVERGEKDPEVLHRLVQLENNLKKANLGTNTRTPDKVMRMDKIIDKAMKDGLKKINITDGKNASEGIKQIEKTMNKELGDRKKIEAPKDNS